MAFIQYPVVKVITSLGPISLSFTDGGHVAAHVEAHSNGNEPTLVYKGTEYLGMIHLWEAHDWQEKPGDFSYVSKRKNGQSAPPTHYRALIAAVRDAVIEYLDANPDTLRAAEYANANNAADSAQGDVDRIQAELDAAHAVLQAARHRMVLNRPQS